MIRHSTAMESFSAAASAMAGDGNVVDIVASLVSDCTEILPATSAAILLRQDAGLVLLHSSSHAASEIEMLQVQSERGPCVDSIEQDVVVAVAGAEALRARWHDVGDSIVRAGYLSVASFPMRWHDRVLGGLNIFRSQQQELSSTEESVAQGFANMATLALVRPSDVPYERLTARVAEAIRSRSVIEQAKGVLAQRHGIEPGDAYDLLVEQARSEEEWITTVATAIVRSVHA